MAIQTVVPRKRKGAAIAQPMPCFEADMGLHGNIKKWVGSNAPYGSGDFLLTKWSVLDIANACRRHWLLPLLGICFLFFMGVEYTHRMVPPTSQPLDIGFVATRPLHRALLSRPNLSGLLAALNTVFVGMQATYILWTLLFESRPRAVIATLLMFTFRGILGYATQLPLPEDFLGSPVDFPVGNVSFFLFFSGHVGASVIAATDMRRMQRWDLAWAFDVLNVLQVLRLLGTRGHYTIDLAVGYGAGILCDNLAERYENCKLKPGSELS